MEPHDYKKIIDHCYSRLDSLSGETLREPRYVPLSEMKPVKDASTATPEPEVRSTYLVKADDFKARCRLARSFIKCAVKILRHGKVTVTLFNEPGR